jgi:hypothetical protein
MENLIGALRDAVALLMVVRIAVLAGVILIVLRLGYYLINSPQYKRWWHNPRKGFSGYKNMIKTRPMNVK